MEHLLEVQREIARKTDQDKIESDQIVQDLVESNRRLNLIMSSPSPYSLLKNVP